MTGSRAGSGVPAPAAVAARLGAAADRMLNAGKRPRPVTSWTTHFTGNSPQRRGLGLRRHIELRSEHLGSAPAQARRAAVTLHPRRPRPPACSAAEFAQIHPRAIRPFRADQYPPREQIRAPRFRPIGRAHGVAQWCQPGQPE